MSEQTSGAPPPAPGARGAAGAAPTDGEFAIRKVYVKDLSFETPNSPRIFGSDWKPDVDLRLHTETAQVTPGDYEVVLVVTVTVKLGDLTAFLAEVQVAGIFAISGLTSEELEGAVGSYCPGILFPFAREVVSDLSIRGGFPQILLAPVNFEALYAEYRAAKTPGVDPAPGA